MSYSPYRSARDPDAAPMPPAAQDVCDQIVSIRDRIAQMHDYLSDLAGTLDDKEDAVFAGAHGYTQSHARAWCALDTEAAAVELALFRLLQSAAVR